MTLKRFWSSLLAILLIFSFTGCITRIENEELPTTLPETSAIRSTDETDHSTNYTDAQSEGWNNDILFDSDLMSRMQTDPNEIVESLYQEALAKYTDVDPEFSYSIAYCYLDLNNDGNDEILSYIRSIMHSGGSGSLKIDIWISTEEKNKYLRIGGISFIETGSLEGSFNDHGTILNCFINGYRPIVVTSTNNKETMVSTYYFDGTEYVRETMMLSASNKLQ